LIDRFLETNEKETKDEREIMDQLSPLRDFIKNKKEEPHVNTYGIRFDPIHGDSINISFQKWKQLGFFSKLDAVTNS
jgi:hypothetical protein